MAYDDQLAGRIRRHLAARADVVEVRMFGGLAFMVGGHMACGILGDLLIVRVGPEGFEAALARPHTRPMDFTGRPSRGLVYVAPAGLRTQAALGAWIERGCAHVATLPAKKRARRKPRRAGAARSRPPWPRP